MRSQAGISSFSSKRPLARLWVRDFLVNANPKAARAIVMRFEEALPAAFWQSRRNSTLACLASMRETLA